MNAATGTETYEAFAQVYDLFMDETPYSEWADYLQQIWQKYNAAPKLLLDLGCGTGSLCLELARRGYEMIGMDLSSEMLGQAKSKAESAGVDVLLINQDMRSFELYGTVDGIVSLCDSLNYILEEDELFEVFKRAATYLEVGGIFVFDLNTRFKYENELACNTFAETFEEAAYIWENNYDPATDVNEYAVNFFIADGRKYERYEEIHRQRAYDIETVSGLLKRAGLSILSVYDAYGFDSPKKNSGRIFFVAAK